MTYGRDKTVSVVIAAHDASGTLDRAVMSALAEPETLEVIVVDDASADSTRAVAYTAAQRDARVRVLPLDVNAGPGAARNRALDVAEGRWLAILDADDVFLPGRLRRLVACRETEIVADNIVFGSATAVAGISRRPAKSEFFAFEPLDAVAFVKGNLPQRGIARGELGFLKPLLSREFLIRHGLRYDESLRLGEDYDLYLRMLLAGARMRLTRQPGYGAEIRPGSLSARHRTEDLVRLTEALSRYASKPGLERTLARALRTHLRALERRRDHRVFLELRRTAGAGPALRYAFGTPSRAPGIALRIARDKLGLAADAGAGLPEGYVRPLLPLGSASLVHDLDSHARRDRGLSRLFG